MDRGNGVLDGNFQAVAPDEDAARRQMHGANLQNGQLRRRLGGFGAAGIPGSEYLGHGAPRCLLQRPTGHLLRHQIQESDVSGDVRADHRLANAVEGDQSALFFRE
jgi:hypothetical protein